MDNTPAPRKPNQQALKHIKKPAALKKVKFTVQTYTDLQPFLMMADVLLEGVYEHMSELSTLEEH